MANRCCLLAVLVVLILIEQLLDGCGTFCLPLITFIVTKHACSQFYHDCSVLRIA